MTEEPSLAPRGQWSGLLTFRDPTTSSSQSPKVSVHRPVQSKCSLWTVSGSGRLFAHFRGVGGMKLSKENVASQELVACFPSCHCLLSPVLMSGSEYPFSSGGEQSRYM